MAFDKIQFIAELREALGGDRVSLALREVVARAVRNPDAVMREIGEPSKGGLGILHRSPELTVLNVVWPAGSMVMPHDHAMRAIIGVYAGREDNILWRRLPETTDGRIEAAGARSLGPGDAVAFGPEVIHSVVNPVGKLTGAIHIYDGDFFAAERSEWDPQSLNERPYDLGKLLRTLPADTGATR